MDGGGGAAGLHREGGIGNYGAVAEWNKDYSAAALCALKPDSLLQKGAPTTSVSLAAIFNRFC